MQFNNKLKKNNKGFTLLELIVTVVILALITAPFLSSFASASKTNVKSKRIQEANELSQRIIEQFKGSSVDKMVNDYGLTFVENRIDTTDMKYSKNSKFYTGTVRGTSLPTGFTSGYSADIKLTPAKSIVNEDNVIPVVEKLKKENCVVIAGNITQYDTISGATGRDVKVRVWKDSSTSKYKVELTIQYKNGIANVGSPKTIPSIPWEYDVIPSIYILYVPMGTPPVLSNDTICIDNDLYGSDLEQVDADGNTYRGTLNTYIIQQDEAPGSSYSYTNVNSNGVWVEEKKDDGTDIFNKYLSDLLDPTNGAKLTNTVLHTNIGIGISNDKNGTVYDAVKAVKIDTIYNLDIAVKYDGKVVASYNATKTVSGD